MFDAKGLYTYASPIGAQSIAGAMNVALNVNCDEIGITTTRRGFNFYSTHQFTTTHGNVIKLFSYLNHLYTSFNGGQFAQDNGSGTWTTYGSGFLMNPPSGGFLHQMLAGGNSYFTTSNGIYKLSGFNSNPPIPAGAPAALDTTVTPTGIISSGFLNAQSQCAYEIVWGYIDQSNLEIVGAPSFPVTVQNTASSSPSNNVNTTVVATIPPFVEQNKTLPWFYQIYRTLQTGSLSVPPGNNYQLVTQLNPTSTDYTNHYVSFYDSVLDSLLGASLYTADGQPDVGNPYQQPPLCIDAAYFNSMAFYANFTTLQSVILTLISVGSPSGLQAGDTVSITDSATATTYTYTGATSTAGTSVSGATPATTATALTFNINIDGDGAQAITVDDGGTHTGAAVAAALQTAIRGLTANNPANQPGISNATAVYTTVYTVTSGIVASTGFPSSVVITGAGASTLKLGVANGGTETAGTNANNPTSRTFNVVTGGSPSVNIQSTARNLVQVVDQDPNNSLFIMFYTSSASQLPGQMQIEAQNLSQAFFSINSSRTTAWSPSVPSSGTAYASASVSVPNGIHVSQVAKPESCPPSFIEFVGSPNFPIERIIPVRTALIIVKPEEGVFEITGTSPTTLTVTTLDTTAFIKASETMAALNNAGYFFTTQGVMSVNESGCEIMSRNVQGDILALASSNYPNFPTLAFSVGYQSDNAYILFLQENPSDTYSTLQYRYNWITQAWTNWNKATTAAIINPADDKLYIATPAGFILQERKTFTNQDYADETIAINITAVGSSTLTLTSSANTGIGDQISQTNISGTFTCFVVANNTSTNVITVTTTLGFITGSATDTFSISSTIEFMPTTGGYPAYIKKFTTWNFDFTNISFNLVTASFTTDFVPGGETVNLVPKQSNTWGTFPWGTVPWGVTTQSLQAITAYPTKNTAIGHWANVALNLQQAFSGFGLTGYALFFEFMGQRSK